MQPGKLLILFWLLFLTNSNQASFCLGFNRGILQVPDSAVVARINGETVVAGEFLLLAGKLRPLVISELMSKYSLEYSGNFWSTVIDGQTPSGVLKRLTMDTLLRIKVLQQNARDAGLVKDISFTGFRRALVDENQRRESDYKAGKVIYGPVQYREDVYYSYLFTTMTVKLKESLESTFIPREEVLKEEYNRNRQTLCSQGQLSKTGLLLVRPGCLAGSGPTPWIRIAGSGFRVMMMDFNDTVRKPEETDPLTSLVMQAADTLQEGGCSHPILRENNLCTVFLFKREPLGCKSYEKCRTIIRTVLVNRMFDRYVSRLATGASCQINHPVYDRLTF